MINEQDVYRYTTQYGEIKANHISFSSDLEIDFKVHGCIICNYCHQLYVIFSTTTVFEIFHQHRLIAGWQSNGL